MLVRRSRAWQTDFAYQMLRRSVPTETESIIHCETKCFE